MRFMRFFFLLIILVFLLGSQVATQPVIVGCKHFNESYILAEIISQLLEDRGFDVERRFGLGGTLICFEAITNGEIDIYPEYSGTIEQAILKLSYRPSYQELQHTLKRDYQLGLLDSFGFNNTYAIAVRRNMAEELNLKTINDLKDLSDLQFSFSHEFLNRKDGWIGLAETYSLSVQPLGIEHGLIYQAINENKVDVIDAYSTDAKIKKFDLVLLEDTKNYFPEYLAAPLTRSDLDPRIQSVLNELSGKITQDEMQDLNARVALDNKSFAEVAHDYLLDKGLLKNERTYKATSRWTALLNRTLVHIKLTVIALVAAMCLAIPFGVAIYWFPTVSRPIIYFTGLMQTIPSIALLAFMIPFFGIGTVPAIIALFLYALLPILRNTFTALTSIDPILKKVSVGMGLTSWQRLVHIEIPLGAPTILAGIKTAAVISVGTATLAAFIGAGGLGEPIVTGLSLNDPYLILEGAIPAALLAILVEFCFEFLERAIIPKHLLQRYE